MDSHIVHFSLKEKRKLASTQQTKAEKERIINLVIRIILVGCE